MKHLFLGIIWLYQHSFVYLLPPNSCRFYPSCSHYAQEAVGKYGAAKGGWLAAKRIARCQPFCAGGFDPVP